MPGLGGVDVVRSLRGNAQTATARLVVVGDMSQADLEACVEAGADAAYRKPVKPSELVASIETMVSSPNPFMA
jgi:CheY-like chemotaxis protein